MKFTSIAFTALLIFGIYGCQQEEPQNSTEFKDGIKEKMQVFGPLDLYASNGRQAAGIEGRMATINEALAAYNLQLEKIEYLGAEQEGATVLFEDRGKKQLASDFVPFDPRNGTGASVPYVIDGTEQGTTSGMSEAATISAIINSMNTWGSVTCSKGLDLPPLGTAGFDLGFVQYAFGFGGFPGFISGAITHGGVLPAAFFDAIAPGGGSSILGVTFTLVYTDSDIDGNGKSDVAFKEIYMNDNFNWQDAPDDVLFNAIFDFETVVLHEVGHGLSQGHFGKAFITNKGEFKFAPEALMNAGYSIANREVEKTDKAGHCSNWADWPNN